MKLSKNLKGALTALCAGTLLSSCVYYADSDYSKILNKTTYKTFDSLNEPIVLEYGLKMMFSTKDNKNHSTVYNGTVLAVYDWENNKVVDYVYAPGIDGIGERPASALCLKGTDGKLKYYAADEAYQRIYVMDSTKNQLTYFAAEEPDAYWGHPKWGDSTNIINGKGIRYFCNSMFWENNVHVLSIKTIDAKNDGFNSVVEYPVVDVEGMATPILDADGNYWFTLLNDNSDTYEGFSTIRKFNVTQNKFEKALQVFNNNEGAVYDEYDGWNYTFTYKTVACDDSYVYVLRKNLTGKGSAKLYALDKANGDKQEITLPEGKIYSFIDFVNVNSEVYGICCNADNMKINLYKVNGADQSFNLVPVEVDSKDDVIPVVRGSNLFLITKDVNEPYKEIIRINLESNVVSPKATIKMEDFAN